MPLFFLIVGALFLIAAVRGDEQTTLLLDTMKADFTGPNNFFVWSLAIGVVVGFGYVPKMRPISNMLLALVFVALILAHSDKVTGESFFNKFLAQVRQTEKV